MKKEEKKGIITAMYGPIDLEEACRNRKFCSIPQPSEWHKCHPFQKALFAYVYLRELCKNGMIKKEQK